MKRMRQVDRCNSFHNCGRSVGSFKGSGCFTRGSNYRMQHYQAAMLVQQIEKLAKETEVRRENADYLSANLEDIPGVNPARLPENSRAVWHLYPLRYDAEKFNGLSRVGFMRALRAEGFLDPVVDVAVTPASSASTRRVVVGGVGGRKVTLADLAFPDLDVEEATHLAARFTSLVARIELATAQPSADRRLLGLLAGLGLPGKHEPLLVMPVGFKN